MMHSIYINTGDTDDASSLAMSVNTYDKWRIVPTSRPVVNPPAYKKKTLDIPGASGSLDISEALTGYPVFENRTGSWEFVVLNDWDGVDNYQWARVYESIMSIVHGKECTVILEDDFEYWYRGRLTVNQWKSDKDHSLITIDYEFQPYKYSILSSIQADWLWDTFYFGLAENKETHIDGDTIVPSKFYNVTVHSTGTIVDAKNKMLGDAPFCPAFDISNCPGTIEVSVTYTDHSKDEEVTITKNFGNGLHYIYEVTLYNTDVMFKFKGSGFVSIIFNRGYL